MVSFYEKGMFTPEKSLLSPKYPFIEGDITLSGDAERLQLRQFISQFITVLLVLMQPLPSQGRDPG